MTKKNKTKVRYNKQTVPRLVENSHSIITKVNFDALLPIIKTDNIAEFPDIIDPKHEIFDHENRIYLLHTAAQYDSHQIAKKLIEKGANVVEDYFGETPLHRAVKYNSYNVAELLIQHFPTQKDIDRQDNYGDTPLNSVKIINSKNMFELLLKNGADPNSINGKGSTILHRLIMLGEQTQDCLSLLLDNDRVDIKIRNKQFKIRDGKIEDGVPVLFLSLEKKYLFAVDKLIAKGADVTETFISSDINGDKTSFNTLQFALTNSSTEILQRIIDEFRKKKLDINEPDKEGYTVLDQLIINFDEDKLKILLKNGIDVSKYLEKEIATGFSINMTSVHFAVYINQGKFIKYVFENKLVDIQTLMSETSLLYMALISDVCDSITFKFIIEQIKNAGLSIDRVDNSGLSPLIRYLYLVNDSQMNVNYDLLDILIKENANINFEADKIPVLYKALFYNTLEVAEWLFKNHAEFKTQTKDGYFTAALAVYGSGTQEVINKKLELIKKYDPASKVKIEIGYTNQLKCTALHLLAYRDPILYNNFNPTGLLLQNSKLANAQDVQKNTPLFYAILKRNVVLCKALIPKTNLTLQNYQNNNVLHYAIRYKLIEIIKLILKQDTEATYQKNQKDKTPFDLIEEKFDKSKVEEVKLLFKDYLRDNIILELNTIILTKEFATIGVAKNIEDPANPDNIVFVFELEKENSDSFFDKIKTEIALRRFSNNIIVKDNCIIFRSLLKKHRQEFASFFKEIVNSIKIEKKVSQVNDENAEDEKIRQQQAIIQRNAKKALSKGEKQNKNHKEKVNVIEPLQENAPPTPKISTPPTLFSHVYTSSVLILKDQNNPEVTPDKNKSYFFQCLTRVVNKKDYQPDLKTSAGVGYALMYYEIKKNSINIDTNEAISATHFRNWLRHYGKYVPERMLADFLHDVVKNPTTALKERELYKVLEKYELNSEMMKTTHLTDFDNYFKQVHERIENFYTSLIADNICYEKIDLNIALINEIGNLSEIFYTLSPNEKTEFNIDQQQILYTWYYHLHYIMGHDPIKLFHWKNHNFELTPKTCDEVLNFTKQFLLAFKPNMPTVDCVDIEYNTMAFKN